MFRCIPSIVIGLVCFKGLDGTCSTMNKDIDTTKVATMCRNSAVDGTEVYIDTDLGGETNLLDDGVACTCQVQTQRGNSVSMYSYFGGNEDCGTSLQFYNSACASNVSVSTPCYTSQFCMEFHNYTTMLVGIRRDDTPYNSAYCVKFTLYQQQSSESSGEGIADWPLITVNCTAGTTTTQPIQSTATHPTTTTTQPTTTTSQPTTTMSQPMTTSIQRATTTTQPMTTTTHTTTTTTQSKTTTTLPTTATTKVTTTTTQAVSITTQTATTMTQPATTTTKPTTTTTHPTIISVTSKTITTLPTATTTQPTTTTTQPTTTTTQSTATTTQPMTTTTQPATTNAQLTTTTIQPTDDAKIENQTSDDDNDEEMIIIGAIVGALILIVMVVCIINWFKTSDWAAGRNLNNCGNSMSSSNGHSFPAHVRATQGPLQKHPSTHFRAADTPDSSSMGSVYLSPATLVVVQRPLQKLQPTHLWYPSNENVGSFNVHDLRRGDEKLTAL